MKPQTIQIFLPEGSSTSDKEAELTNRLIKTIWLLRSTIINILLGVMFACNAGAGTGSSTQSDSEWFVPEGVVYIPSDDKQVETVRKELKKTFSKHKKGIYKLAKKQSGYFFLGPLLSSRIRDESPSKVAELRTVGYRVKLTEDFEPKFQGILAKTNKEKKMLSQLLSDRIGDFKEIKLRRLKPDELAFMWYFISWDIKEPVFVLETDKHTLLVDVGAISENQLWIEEISNPCYKFGFEEIISPCLCFEVMMEGKKWSAGFLGKPQECGINNISSSSISEQKTEENQNLTVKLDSVLFIDDEYLIGENLETKMMASWIKKVEQNLNENVLPGQNGKIAIKVTASIIGHPKFEIKYLNEINEDWLSLVKNQLALINPINALHEAVRFELVFNVNSSKE